MTAETRKSVLISHEVTNLGRINVSLHGFAATLFEQLLKDGLIDYLKGIDHLGFISKSHPGNNHKRWDYVCLQLFLIQKLKHSAFNTGINSTTTIENQSVSNQELLQLFVLIANIGHLEGTISAEKALFDYLKSNSEAKTSFLKNFESNPKLKMAATVLFANNDTYNSNI